MKKLMTLALSMVVSSMLFAHSGNRFNRNNQDSDKFWQGMNSIHDVMHNTLIAEKQTDNGVTFEITANLDSTIESIKKRFVDDQTKLEAYFKDVDVTVKSLDKGFEVILESNNANTVKNLQTTGKSSIYRYLHSGIEEFHGSRGYHHGYGFGMMHSRGYRNGSGAEMMGQGGRFQQGHSGSNFQYNDHMYFGNETM